MPLITKPKRNMKNKLMPLMDKLLTRKRSIIETIIDPLKNISQIVRVSVPKANIHGIVAQSIVGSISCAV